MALHTLFLWQNKDEPSGLFSAEEGSDTLPVSAGIILALVLVAPTNKAKSHLALADAVLYTRSKELASVSAGLVLGIATNIVTPPAKAAAVPDIKSQISPLIPKNNQHRLILNI